LTAAGGDIDLTASGTIALATTGNSVTITRDAILSFDGATDQNEAITSDGTDLTLSASDDIHLSPSGTGHVTVPSSKKISFDGTTDYDEYIESGLSVMDCSLLFFVICWCGDCCFMPLVCSVVVVRSRESCIALCFQTVHL
jgi:hypothetical protein